MVVTVGQLVQVWQSGGLVEVMKHVKKVLVVELVDCSEVVPGLVDRSGQRGQDGSV